MPEPQALLIATIVGALVEVCKSLVGRVLVALGISFVTYQGFDGTLGWVKSDVISRIGALPRMLSACSVFYRSMCASTSCLVPTWPAWALWA